MFSGIAAASKSRKYPFSKVQPMKTSFQIFSLLFGSLIAFIMWSFQPAFNALGQNNQMIDDLSAFSIPYTPRQDVTFLLGKDQAGENPYFAKAAQYYRQDPKEQTEFVIDSCKSLLAVRNYLETHAPDNGRAWGKINLVFHSNEWTGMGVPTLPGGKRTTTQSLANAIAGDQFPPLSETIIDACTEIVFHGCALGRNEGLLSALRAAFVSPKVETKIMSSPYFVIFDQQQNTYPKRYLADYWYVFFQTGKRPSDQQLVQQLNTNYPKAPVDWDLAIQQNQPLKNGQPFHYTFKVPVVWTVTYPDEESRPDISNWKAQQKWLDDQTALKAVFEKYKIPREQFSWYLRKLDYTFEDGSTEPAIKAVGFCTVLCVLQEVEERNDSLVSL